jgi:putative phosphoribosyl transferase
MLFVDRRDAGRRLAERVVHHLAPSQAGDVVVLGLARGGVPVAFEVARALAAPLDVILVRKLGVPYQPELAAGAIGEGGVRVLNDDVVRASRVTPADLKEVEAREQARMDERGHLYRAGGEPVALAGCTAVIVDDGMATGSTARAACLVAQAHGAPRVVLAVPVASPSAVMELSREVEVVCVETPSRLWAIGEWYGDFSQTTDGEVAVLLREARRRR